VHQQFYCPYDKKVVPRDELILGYEIEKDKYITVDQSELKRLQPHSSTAMEILQFVKLSEVDPIYFETSYFSVPEEAGVRAYSLLFDMMKESKYAALAQITMHQRERIVIIRPYQNGLILHTIYYPNEIREVKEYGKHIVKNLKKQEIVLAEQFAKGLVKPFRPAEFHDEYRERVMKLIESKSKGHAAPKTEKPQRLAPVVDLMSALKKSLASKSKPHGSFNRKKLKKIA
jgi:DNA end-binding protein Ku